MPETTVTSVIIQFVAYDFEIRHFGTVFGTNTVEYKTCFDLVCNLHLNYFSLEMSRNPVINLRGCTFNLALIIVRFKPNFNFQDSFLKNTRILNSIQVRAVAEFFFLCGLIDTRQTAMTK